MDFKDVKSLLSSLGFILFYVFATIGIVKLLFDTSDSSKFEGRVKFILLFQITFFLFYIIGIYHIVGPHNVDDFYMVYLIFQIIYSLVGLVAYFTLKSKSE